MGHTRDSALQLARLDNGGLLVVVDLSGAGAGGLKRLDDIHGLVVSDLAEDDVLAVEPAGDDGGDEELGAVAARECVSGWLWKAVLRPGRERGVSGVCLRVGAGVGHGQKSWLGVLLLEVLIGELLTVD